MDVRPEPGLGPDDVVLAFSANGPHRRLLTVVLQDVWDAASDYGRDEPVAAGCEVTTDRMSRPCGQWECINGLSGVSVRMWAGDRPKALREAMTRDHLL